MSGLVPDHVRLCSLAVERDLLGEANTLDRKRKSTLTQTLTDQAPPAPAQQGLRGSRWIRHASCTYMGLEAWSPRQEYCRAIEWIWAGVLSIYIQVCVVSL